MIRTIALILTLCVSGCVTRLYQGAPKSEAQVVLMARHPMKDRPVDVALTLISIGLYPGDWELSLDTVDGETVYNEVEMSPGAHTVSGRASQGPTGILGKAAIWRCKGSIEFNFYPGSYEIAFNYDKGNPELRIDDKASGATVATGECNRVSVWTGREMSS